MRVVFIIPSLGCGGAERLAASMANYWKRAGWEISVLTFAPAAVEPFFTLDPGITYRGLDLAGNSPNAIAAALRNLWRILKLRRSIRRERPDVAISFMDRTNIYAAISMLGLGTPLIITEHSVPDIQSPGRIWNLLRRWIYPAADCLVVQTPEAGRYFRPWFKKPALIIPNAVEPDLSAELTGAESRQKTGAVELKQSRSQIIAAAGRLSAEKGFDRLISAFSQILPNHPNAKLIIWGEGPLRAELERQRDNLGLSQSVQLPGTASPLAPKLLTAEIFVLSSRYEGFGNVLLEAMALGLPVVSFDCPLGPRQIISNEVDGLLVENDDIDGLARAISRLLGDDILRKRLGSRAIDSAARFGLPRIMPQWENAISTVVKKRSILLPMSGSSTPRRRVRCCFLTRRLDVGGAERQLLELVRGLPAKGITPIVVTFYDGGGLAGEIKRFKGVRHISLHKSGRWDIVPFLSRLLSVLRRTSPEIVHGYLMMSNVLSVCIGPLLKSRPGIVWSYRTSNTGSETYDLLGRIVLFAEKHLSRFADAIIANSTAGKDDAIRRGFPSANITIVRNGIDIEKFQPAPQLGRNLRLEWGVTPAEPLIGLIARLDLIKRHRLFFQAAAEYCKFNRTGKFLLCGDGPADYRAELQSFAKELGIEKRVIWSGSRSDMAAVYSALNVCTLCSNRAEGFPNVIGEAMACGTPCVTTDCGDAAFIVGEFGYVVLDDPSRLAEAWSRCLTEYSDLLSSRLRARIENEFSTDKLIARTIDVLARINPAFTGQGADRKPDPLKISANL